jgi:hypothetical protein
VFEYYRVGGQLYAKPIKTEPCGIEFIWYVMWADGVFYLRRDGHWVPEDIQ